MNTDRNFSIFLAVVGFIGALAASVLLVERINLLEDPNYVPMCSLSDVLNCSNVMTTDQAKVFGFPNPIIGIIGFSVVMTIGFAGLAGAAFKAWFWGGLQVGVTFAFIFIHWLMYQTLYEIYALCLYCMIVWAVTGPLFWYVTIKNLGAFDDVDDEAPGLLAGTPLAKYHWVVPAIWYVIVIAMVWKTFWL